MELRTLGADPEIFLVDAQGNFKSAIGIIPGNKHRPSPVKELGKGFAIQADNVLCEYNIPALNVQGRSVTAQSGFVDLNRKILSYIKDFILSPRGLNYKIIASASMPEEELNHPDAHVFGCEPDYNVYALDDNPRPCSTDANLRSAGGHIHLGGLMSKVEKIVLGRWLDVVLAAPMTTIDLDVRRRELYGKAGAIRFKPYGMEYRTLSNYWLTSDRLIHTVVSRVMQAAKSVSTQAHLPTEISAFAVQAINEGNKSALDNLYESGYTQPIIM